MRNWFRVVLLALAVVMLVACLGGSYITPSGSTPGNSADVTGFYRVRGKGVNGSYSGEVTITREKEVYSVVWSLDDGSQIVGVGLLEGNVFSVAWQAGDMLPGVVVYRVEGDKLVGRWTVAGETSVWTETLTRK